MADMRNDFVRLKAAYFGKYAILGCACATEINDIIMLGFFHFFVQDMSLSCCA